MAASINIQIPFDTIEAIHNDEGITQALKKLAVNSGASSKVIHDIAAKVIKTIEELPYQVTSKTALPPRSSAASDDGESDFCGHMQDRWPSRASSPCFGIDATKSRARSADGWCAASPSVSPSSPVDVCDGSSGWCSRSITSSRDEVSKSIVIVINYDGWNDGTFTINEDKPFSALVELFRQRDGRKRMGWEFETLGGHVFQGLDYQKSLNTLGFRNGSVLLANKTYADNDSAGYQMFDISIRDLMGKQHDLCFEGVDTFQNVVDCYKSQAGYEGVELDFFRITDGEESALDDLVYDESLKWCFDYSETFLCKPKAAKISLKVRNAMNKVSYLKVDRKITMSELDKIYCSSTDSSPGSLQYEVDFQFCCVDTSGWTSKTLVAFGIQHNDEITVRPYQKRPGSACSSTIVRFDGAASPVQDLRSGWDSVGARAGGWD